MAVEGLLLEGEFQSIGAKEFFLGTGEKSINTRLSNEINLDLVRYEVPSLNLLVAFKIDFPPGKTSAVSLRVDLAKVCEARGRKSS